MKDLYKDFEKLTPNQALEQGYTKCVAEGCDVAYNITDCVEDGKLYDKYIVCEKESRPAYQFNSHDFKEMLFDYLENCDEETLACMENFDDLIEKESFAEVIHLLNQTLTKVQFWPCVGILLVDEQLTK